MLTDELKNATQENHQRLEGKLVRQMKSMQSVDDYIQLLQNFYTFFAPLESQITKYVDDTVLPDIAERRKTELLHRDLEKLNGHKGETDRTQTMTIANSAEAIGTLYVMEGSTLGGPFIAQLIKKQLPDVPAAYTFFEGYGTATQEMWQRFRTTINELRLSPEAQQQALNKANETFEKMYDWF
jgi:heme oxygenase (biliverdin-IX-beta and delta-forming)